MENITRNFTVTDSFGDVATIKIGQNNIKNLIGWLKKLNLLAHVSQITLWTYSWLRNEFLKAEELPSIENIEIDMFDDDFYRHTEEGNLFQVTVRAIDGDRDDWFWVNLMFGFNENNLEQVSVSHQSPYTDPISMERFTGHSESYTLNSWKDGMAELQKILTKAFPEVPAP